MKELTTFSALSEPNRMRIVELLIGGPLTVNEVAARLGLRQPQASKHLHVLLDAELVEVQADANRRHYKLRLEPFQLLDAWLQTYRGVWDERMDALEQYLQKLRATEGISKETTIQEE